MSRFSDREMDCLDQIQAAAGDTASRKSLSKQLRCLQLFCEFFHWDEAAQLVATHVKDAQQKSDIR